MITDVPHGPKDNLYYPVDQTINIDRETRGECRVFRDDCGAWDSVRSATLRQLLLHDGVYCVRKNV